jgi:hypothetical protein
MNLGAMARQLGGVFGATTSTLATVTDADSAQAALPSLEEASASLTAVSDQFDAVPDTAKGALSSVIGGGMDRVSSAAESALAIDGVGDVLSPVLTPMMETLQGLAGN